MRLRAIIVFLLCSPATLGPVEAVGGADLVAPRRSLVGPSADDHNLRGGKLYKVCLGYDEGLANVE
jgi:hypothetical protein